MQSFYDVILSPFDTPVAGASIFVYQADGTLATLYSDIVFTPANNPLTSDAEGKYAFYADNGLYYAIIVAAGYDNKTVSNIVLNDPGASPGTVNIQEFTTVGTSTWTKPTGAKFVEVLMYGGGGGGGSGRRRSASTANAASGGGGGGAGSRMEIRIPAFVLADTETVVVGAGGTGGAAQTVDETNGNSGDPGAITQFAAFSVVGGLGGTGGVLVGTAAAGLARQRLAEYRSGTVLYSSAGASGQPNVGSAGNKGGYMPGGGAGGAGFGAGSTTSALGAEGGRGGDYFSGDASVTTGGGGTAGTAGGNGGDGIAFADYGNWAGGPGGGSGGCTSTQAGSGGAGGYPGGGGGGGAAASGAFNSGAGGDGGEGFVRVVTYL